MSTSILILRSTDPSPACLSILTDDELLNLELLHRVDGLCLCHFGCRLWVDGWCNRCPVACSLCLPCLAEPLQLKLGWSPSRARSPLSLSPFPHWRSMLSRLSAARLHSRSQLGKSKISFFHSRPNPSLAAMDDTDTGRRDVSPDVKADSVSDELRNLKLQHDSATPDQISRTSSPPTPSTSQQDPDAFIFGAATRLGGRVLGPDGDPWTHNAWSARLCPDWTLESQSDFSFAACDCLSVGTM